MKLHRPKRFLRVALCTALLGSGLLLAGPGEVFAQRERPQRLERAPMPGPQRERMNPEDRQRLREDVNSARGDYRGERVRRDEGGGNRMSPEERERLRRD